MLIICLIMFPCQVFATNQSVNQSGDEIYLKTYEEYEQFPHRASTTLR